MTPTALDGAWPVAIGAAAHPGSQWHRVRVRRPEWGARAG